MTVLRVGQGQAFATIASAVNAAASGDTIDVAAGTYTNDFTYIGKSLTLQAVGGMARMVETVSPPNGKAMIVSGVKGAAITIAGFDISGVAVADKNGAAIRYEGGALTLWNDYFHDNQEGLLGAADPAGSITVTHSEFAHNGDGSGFTHNLYAGHIARLTISNSYFHDAVVGHEIKSRANVTTITGSRIFDNASTASYSVDAPNGGTVNISGNQIEQGPNSENLYLFAYGEEGASNGGAETIRNNTIVNDRAGARAVLSRGPAPVALTGNRLWNLPDLGTGVAASGNTVLATRPVLDTSHLSFITGPSPPPVVVPPPPPPPPPPTLTLAEYRADVWADFLAWAPLHPQLAVQAVPVFVKEISSTTVLGVIPGDLWSH